MNSVNKTLYIPLYGKAYVSRLGILLKDPKAEEIWAAEGFPLKRKARSKWLAYNMAMRAAVFDRWLEGQLAAHPGAVVIHGGCGMDSRNLRVDAGDHFWFDVDFPEVVAERRRYFSETEHYRMIPSDIRDTKWLEEVPRDIPAIVVLEGLSMYLPLEELNQVLLRWKAHFSQVHLLMDSYTTFGARATKYKNPINEVGVTQVYGFDDPRAVTALSFAAEHSLTPEEDIRTLKKCEQRFFRTLFAGKTAHRIYRLYEYKS